MAVSKFANIPKDVLQRSSLARLVNAVVLKENHEVGFKEVDNANKRFKFLNSKAKINSEDELKTIKTTVDQFFYQFMPLDDRLATLCRIQNYLLLTSLTLDTRSKCTLPFSAKILASRCILSTLFCTSLSRRPFCIPFLILG